MAFVFATWRKKSLRQITVGVRKADNVAMGEWNRATDLQDSKRSHYALSNLTHQHNKCHSCTLARFVYRFKLCNVS